MLTDQSGDLPFVQSKHVERTNFFIECSEGAMPHDRSSPAGSGPP